MKMMTAFAQHVWLIMRFKHDGAGMPKDIPAALLIALVYCSLTVINTKQDLININTILGLIFLTQFYVFLLRNQIIGLILMIGIIANFGFLLINTFNLTYHFVYITTLFEYAMIFFSIINVIKSNFKLT